MILINPPPLVEDPDSSNDPARNDPEVCRQNIAPKHSFTIEMGLQEETVLCEPTGSLLRMIV
jgi:hypothetical protein